jgi:hypothetical protein
VVTHSISFLSKFDQLAYVRRGIIVESGSYANLAGDKASQVYKLMLVRINTYLIYHEIADSIVVTGTAIQAGPRHLEA